MGRLGATNLGGQDRKATAQDRHARGNECEKAADKGV
jgi:hypothetical protein